MAATTVTFTDKANNRSLPTVATENKVSAADMNQLKTAINDNAAITDTNTGNISTNGANITSNNGDIVANTAKLAASGSSDSNTIDLTNTLGTMHEGAGGTAMADLTFSLAASPVAGGWAVIRSNAADVPVIYGAVSRNDFATNYTTGADNYILVWVFSASLIFYSLIP